MFKHLFASMNEMLDEVIAEFPTATGVKQRELQEKVRSLKAMSDDCIEDWLLFEEKLGGLLRTAGAALQGSGNDPQDPELTGKRSEWFVRGQGFYKLHMYDQSIEAFEELLKLQPDFNLARIYLAMSYLRKGEEAESYSHFQFISQLTENLQMKAISYNAMGCIQARQLNLDKACEFFDMAYRTDPASVAPLLELGVCSEQKGGLQFVLTPQRDPLQPDYGA